MNPPRAPSRYLEISTIKLRNLCQPRNFVRRGIRFNLGVRRLDGDGAVDSGVSAITIAPQEIETA